MIFAPEGLIGIFHRVKAAVQHRSVERKHRTWLSDFFGITKPPLVEVPVTTDDGDAPLPAADVRGACPGSREGATVAEPAVLEAADVRVTFGGVRAVDGVSLDVRDDEILGLVGPNGSGKTTFLNALTGVVPASGSLEVAGQPVPLGTPGRSRAVGVVRTYQAPQTYDRLSCIEDVLDLDLGPPVHGRAGAWFLRPLVLRHERARWAVAVDALTRVGLGDLAELPAGRLTYGQRRLLELGAGDRRRPARPVARRAVGRPRRLGDRDPRGVSRRPARRGRVAPRHRPQARLHHPPLRPDRGAGAGPPGRRRRRRHGVRGPAGDRRVPRRRGGARLMLEIRGSRCRTGPVRAVRGIDVDVKMGEVVALIGPNGAGKTSTLRAISGLVPHNGTVVFDGIDCRKLNLEDLARAGLIHVPEGRHVFPTLDVHENLQLGALAGAGRSEGFSIDDVYDLFPPLQPLRKRDGWALSGGEQQMVAVGRALGRPAARAPPRRAVVGTVAEVHPGRLRGVVAGVGPDPDAAGGAEHRDGPAALHPRRGHGHRQARARGNRGGARPIGRPSWPPTSARNRR